MRGLAWLCHHERLVEYVHSFKERVDSIHTYKPVGEQAIRLTYFQMIPEDRIPVDLKPLIAACNEARDAHAKAWDAYVKAKDACDKTWDACMKAGDAHDEALGALNKALLSHAAYFEALHKDLYPDCPWDGKTLFPEKGG